MQRVATALTLEIGFLFKKKNAFENGIAALTKTHPDLAVYLTETRKWSERLIADARNAMEHDGWRLPRVTYNRVGNGLEVVEPEILGQPVSVFVEYMIDRVCCFVEEVTAYGLQELMPSDFSITEIPLAERKVGCPERFYPTLALGGMPIWVLDHGTKIQEHNHDHNRSSHTGCAVQDFAAGWPTFPAFSVTHKAVAIPSFVAVGTGGIRFIPSRVSVHKTNVRA